MSTPTQRSLDYLRKQGYTAAVVEQTIHFPDKQNPGKMTMFKRDLFNLFDILAFKPGIGFLGVQTTSRSNQQSRIQKIAGSREADKWLETGGHIHVHGWAKAGAKGKRKLWEVSVHVMERDEVASALPEEEAFQASGLRELPEGVHAGRKAQHNQGTMAAVNHCLNAAQSDSLFEPEVLDLEAGQ